MNVKESLSVEEVAMEERYTYVELDKFEDIPAFLEEIGILDKPGFFLTDIDETMRASIGDKLIPRNYLNLKAAHFDEIPNSTLDAVDIMIDHGWKVAAVTNQPREGHQVAKVISEKLGFKTVLEEFSDRDAPIFGFKGTKNVLKDAFKFFHGIATDRMYKSVIDSAVEVTEWMKTQNDIKNANIVWTGNNERDVQFGHMLKEYLKSQGFEGNFIMIKLPNMYYDKRN